MQASGIVVPSVSGQQGLETYIGATFTNDQYSQAKFVNHTPNGDATGPCVRMSSSGNGVCYIADWAMIYVLTGGAGVHGVTTCPVPASGDTIQLSVAGTTYTCTDVTTGAHASGTDSTYSTGSPGIIVDQRYSTSYALAQFQADCSPSCGVILTPAATPTFSPAAGSYSLAQAVTISDPTPSSTIYYTTNGTTPTTSSPVYSTSISVSASETVKAIATATGYTTSAMGSAAYTITSTSAYPVTDMFSGSGALSSNWTNTTVSGQGYVPLTQVSGTVVPSISGAQGLETYTGVAFTSDQYSQAKFVNHSSAAGSTAPCVRMSTSGNGVCYLADDGLIYLLTAGAGVHPISSSCPIPASGDTVQLSVVGTTYTCTDVTTGAHASGTDSTYSAGSPGIIIDQRNSTIYALAQFQADCSPSCAGVSTPAATPIFSPAAGSYSSTQAVTISDATPSSTIYYTTNGTTPTTSSPVYSSPISVSSSATVEAIATASGYTTSVVGSAAYTITTAAVTPTFSPGAGSYSSAQAVTISDTTPSSTIYYTTNGTTPTTSSLVYSSPIGVSTTETVKAIATATGYTSSAVGSASYAIGGTRTVTAVAISPQGGVVQSGSTLQFSVRCTYSDSSFDNCAAVGGATWSSSAFTAMSVNSSGLATWAIDPGLGGAVSYNVLVSAGGITDRAQVFGQHPGDTWYQYVTPRSGGNVVVGSTVTIGEGFVVNNASQGVSGTPFQSSCNWTSSNTAIATVDRHGQTTGISPGTVNITCGRAGNGVFGSSTANGWVAPGNVIALNVVAGGTGGTTWYVLPGGGTLYSATNTSGQCSGKVNQTYAYTGGTGVDQACGVGNIRNLWADGVTYQLLQWVISGGDTVIVAQNSAGYNTGLDSPGGSPSWTPINCSGNSYGCFMPSIPSGTAAQHTRILGANFASCHADSAKTLLNVSYQGLTAFNVTNSQFADIACFEVSDKAHCSTNSNYTNHCGATDNYGSDGILEGALTGSVTYTDLFIHGLANEGIHGATGVGVVGNYIHIRGNPEAGIDMDDQPWNSSNISVAGGFTLTYSTTEFSGCVEEYPVVHNYPYIECRDANVGGYGDGFGTASTTGNWLFDHDTWQYNYQDGLDLLHSGMQNLTVTNSLSLGNDGQTYKIGSGDNVVFQNNIGMANCARIYTTIGDEPASAIVPGVVGCRAGVGMVFRFTNTGTYKVQNNTYVGYFDSPVDIGCEWSWDFCNNATTVFQNNLTLGYVNNINGDGLVPAMFYLETADSSVPSNHTSIYMPANNGWALRDHNLFYNVRGAGSTDSSWCPSPLNTGDSCNTRDPLFVGEPASPMSSESSLDNFNFKPAAGSPAIGTGIAIPGITTDYTGATRPNPPSIGAVE